jgi:hypothetical protein
LTGLQYDGNVKLERAGSSKSYGEGGKESGGEVENEMREWKGGERFKRKGGGRILGEVEILNEWQIRRTVNGRTIGMSIGTC